MGFIYLIQNKINGKGYVGQTTWPIEKRWRQHIVDALGEDDKKKVRFITLWKNTVLIILILR